MKRRVASLPPVSETIFNQKVADFNAEMVPKPSATNPSCSSCSKVFTSEGAYESHVRSKKHRLNQSRGASCADGSIIDSMTNLKIASKSETSEQDPAKNAAEARDTSDVESSAPPTHYSSSQCLFCTDEHDSTEDNLHHMSFAHSFFVPDTDYLTDLSGLISYLGEKIFFRNICIFCNRRSKNFRSLQAVRNHMVDKGHCKIAYEPEDRLEISDYYDFTSSYPDDVGLKLVKRPEGNVDEWEDVGDDSIASEDVSEVVVDDLQSDSDTDVDDWLLNHQLTYGDSPYELVLPSGARIGHRSLKIYYTQSFSTLHHGRGSSEDPQSGAALVRRLLSDKNSALVPRKGGFGAFGQGTDVVKARNPGEAREAGKHIRQFRDQQRRELFKTKVGLIANAQKHYRDPLLQ